MDAFHQVPVISLQLLSTLPFGPFFLSRTGTSSFGSFVKKLTSIHEENALFLCCQILLKFYPFDSVGEVPRQFWFLTCYEHVTKIFLGCFLT